MKVWGEITGIQQPRKERSSALYLNRGPGIQKMDNELALLQNSLSKLAHQANDPLFKKHVLTEPAIYLGCSNICGKRNPPNP